MTKKIKIIFFIFWVSSMLASLIETVTYSGFIEKHIGLNLIAVIILTVILSLPLLILNFIKRDKKNNKNDRLFLIFSAFLLVTYALFKIADRLTYTNFVFSTLHIQPNILLWPVLISLLPTMIIWLPRIDFRKLQTTHSILLIFATLIITFNIYKTYKMEWWAFQFIVIHPNASYGDKMRRTVGSEFYNFTQFINKYTPEDSKILIPPQAFPWPQSGNEAFMRYFIYPRKMGNGTEYDSGINLDQYNFVVLNWGETDSVQAPYTHGWPKFDIPAVKTIFMNPDESYRGEVRGDYRYKDYKDKKVWGLIIIKH